MQIKDILGFGKKNLSFEIFPPKANAPFDSIKNALSELSKLRPDFISVTYGAGGSTTKNTIEIASEIQNKYNITALAHLTCVSSTRDEIERILTSLRERGIENILALRGDIPEDSEFPNPRHYEHAIDLIVQIKKFGGFSIGAACYPEGHIECSDIETDIYYLKEKVDAGVDFLITQLFFDNNIMYNYLNKIRAKDINVPVLAGVMPVTSFSQITRILKLSNATLTPEIKEILEKYEHDPESLKRAGIEYAKNQCIGLLANSLDGIHVYTMNKPDVARAITEGIHKFI